MTPFTISFRGTSSSDPDNDIASWSIDFGDGTSASGSWSTDPPTEVVGQSDSDTMVMVFIDRTPD